MFCRIHHFYRTVVEADPRSLSSRPLRITHSPDGGRDGPAVAPTRSGRRCTDRSIGFGMGSYTAKPATRTGSESVGKQRLSDHPGWRGEVERDPRAAAQLRLIRFDGLVAHSSHQHAAAWAPKSNLRVGLSWAASRAFDRALTSPLDGLVHRSALFSLHAKRGLTPRQTRALWGEEAPDQEARCRYPVAPKVGVRH